jgi:predicted phosphodiesterase
MIFITGDTHADFHRFSSKRLSVLNHQFDREKDYYIVCGDFGGLWDDSVREKEALKWLSEKPFTLLFVTGNHENYDMYAKLPVTVWRGGKVQRITENVIRLMNGQIFDIDGIRFFTMGGASSHDVDDGILEPDDPDLKAKVWLLNRRQAMYRINHVSWWKEEIPSREDMDEGIRNLEKAGWNVDVIITHCAPTAIIQRISNGFYKPDILTDYLDTVYQKTEFKKWYFGHYHDNMIVNPKFTMLYEETENLQRDLNRLNEEKDNENEKRNDPAQSQTLH